MSHRPGIRGVFALEGDDAMVRKLLIEVFPIDSKVSIESTT